MQALHKKSSEIPLSKAERHLNLRLLPLLIAVLALMYIVTGFRGWLIFFIGLAGAWLVAWLWTYSLAKNLRVERKIHLPWATVGESVPEQLRLSNHGWLPALWVEITDETASLESPLRMVSDIGQHSTRNRHLSHLFTHRGVYTLGPTHLRTSDPFGIYTLTMHDPSATTILVTPPVLSLSHLKIPSGGWSGEERLRRGFVERNISDVGLRDYVPGDSLRRIHWHASAHTDTLIVRQQEAATSRDWCIYLDLDRDAQAGSGQQSTLELSIVLAASLAMRGLREYRRVGLVLAGPKFTWLEPGSDPSQGWRILRLLAMAQAGDHSFSQIIQHRGPGQSATAILITPAINPAWVAAASRHLQDNRTIALLVNPHDFGSPLDQARVMSALTHSRIPYLRMPGSLLDEAYSTRPGSAARRTTSESLKRYLQQGRQAWQNMG